MRNSFNDLKNNLSEQDIDQIIVLIGYRCRINTCNRIRATLSYFSSSIPSYGILDRLSKENERWSYCAGQSYPDEIKTIREIFLKGK